MRKFIHHLYFWVVIGILVGVIIGVVRPDLGTSLKPLADGFIALIKMLIGPIIFCTVVLGISGAGDMKKVGRVGVKALVYFEVISSIALAIGLFVGNILKPGAGFNVNPASLDINAVAEFSRKASEQSVVDFFLRIIPKTFTDAFTGNGDLLQVLLLAILFGFAMNRLRSRTKIVHEFVEAVSEILFAMMKIILLFAPLGAGAAMAFTVGKFGLHSLVPMARLMGCFYLTCILFVIFVLGTVARFCGFSILRFIYYIRDELLLVLGTSSSESALVPLMQKLEDAGCDKSVVGLVVPSGYSFNLDGTNIYLTMAVLFIAQALEIKLSLGQQLSILGVAMLTSKGASGVTGAGFITLVATLAVVPDIPVAGVTLLLGVDRFMSEARALTNIIGNGVATIVVAKWEDELDQKQLTKVL